MRHKRALPNYGVFDEVRVFEQGPMPGPVSVRGVRLGCMTCEDMWTPEVSECLAESGAELLIVINGSPYNTDKIDLRITMAVARVIENKLPLIYVNQVGGQDELVFDGASFVLAADGDLRAQAPAFEESLIRTNWSQDDDGAWGCAPAQRTVPPEGLDAIYRAMTLGLRDYVNKNGFSGVLIGMSGGIDSALSAVVAVDALGADRVRCVRMPSRYTAQESLDDALECANLLGTPCDTVGIEPLVAAFDQALAPVFEGRAPDTTEENIQARIRGMIIMAMSNKLGPKIGRAHV